MNIYHEFVETVNRPDIPSPNETIAHDFEIDKMIPLIMEVHVYLRKKEDCPLNRGNWMIDIRFFKGRLYCIKLPLQMKKNHVEKWIKPMVDLLEKYKKSQMN